MKDFNVIFDLRSLETNFFAMDDQIRANKLFHVLRQLKMENKHAYEQCRFIWTAPTIDSDKLHYPESDVQKYLSKTPLLPLIFPMELHVLCMDSFADLLKFNTEFVKQYNHFLNVANAHKLIYYQKSKLNNLKILFANNGHQNLVGGPKTPSFHSLVGYLLYNERGIMISDTKVKYNYYTLIKF